MKDSIKVRVAKIEDIPRISYITKIAYKSPFVLGGIVTKPHNNPSLYEDFTARKIYILVAEVDGKIVGAIRYSKIDNNKIYLSQLVVLKSYRGMKVGEKLIEGIEKTAIKKNFKKVTLDCMKEKHLDKYYKKLGYKIDDIKSVKDYHMVYMSKKI